ncbi:TAP-like domain containing protein [Naviculisporaceae sp. PSN 640]
MLFFLWTRLALLMSTALAKPTSFNHSKAKRTGQTIEWVPCTSINNDLVQCANISVPLDYTDPSSNDEHILELARSPAINSPSKGSILLNFGGPGGDDIGQFANGAVLETLHRNTGGYHDLVTFRTRGTGGNLVFSCYDTLAQRALEFCRHKPDDVFPMVPESWEALDAEVANYWKDKQIFANRCLRRNKDNPIGALVGTTFVARDMMQIVDALGEDGLLRYWGFSYGTVLGATVAALFPDQVGRVILDSAASAVYYYEALPRSREDFADYESATRRFMLSECLKAGPKLCPLAADVDTSRPDKIEILTSRIDSLMDRLGRSPPIVNDTIIFKSTIDPLYDALIKTASPGYYSFAAFLLHELLNNRTDIAAEWAKKWDVVNVPEVRAHDAHPAILCGDRVGDNSHGRPDNLQDMIQEIRQVGESQGHVRAVELAQETLYCAKWPFASKEAFNSSLLKVEGGLVTRNPILVLSNTYDIVTPIHAARDLSSRLAGSVLLEQRAIGHGTVHFSVSECTRSAIESYFLNGTLPAPGTVCHLDKNMFQTEDKELVSGDSMFVKMPRIPDLTQFNLRARDFI